MPYLAAFFNEEYLSENTSEKAVFKIRAVFASISFCVKKFEKLPFPILDYGVFLLGNELTDLIGLHPEKAELISKPSYSSGMVFALHLFVT